MQLCKSVRFFYYRANMFENYRRHRIIALHCICKCLSINLTSREVFDFAQISMYKYMTDLLHIFKSIQMCMSSFSLAAFSTLASFQLALSFFLFTCPYCFFHSLSLLFAAGKIPYTNVLNNDNMDGMNTFVLFFVVRAHTKAHEL